MRIIHMLVMPEFKPGDQAPSGYLQWHEWAEAQHKAGLRQKECGRCGKWRYPQQLSVLVDRSEAQSRRGPVAIETAVCNDCAGTSGQPSAKKEAPNA